ncbi:MAG TPA: hypothetical protein VNK48_14655 [Xanthobacteraceae bacterium]|nr:hypothetical protein [Xanthobacteraceae bacterium]
MASILAICSDAADALSLVRPDALIDVTDDNTAQKLYRAMIATLRQIAARHDWQVLVKEKTFTTSATAEQTGAIASDFLRIIQGTVYNRTRRREVAGPVSAAEWQHIQASLATLVNPAFRIRGNALLLTPTPPAGETIAYEYIKNAIGTSADGSVDRATFTADTDLVLFDDELVILGTVWRYRKAEGQDYSEEYREFEMRLYDLIKMDGGRRRIEMAGPPDEFKPRAPQMPDTLTGLS